MIRAVAGLLNVELTIVGDGPVIGALRRLVAALGVHHFQKRYSRPSVPNGELCAELPGYDIFAVRSDYFELSESMLEALLTGMPTVINRRPGAAVPELSDEICLLVEDPDAAYRDACNGS